MITTREGIDNNFAETVNAARREFAKAEGFDLDRSYQAQVVMTPEMMWQAQDDHNFMAYLLRRLFEYEKEMVYRSVVSSGGEWTAIRTRFLSRNAQEFLSGGVEYAVRVDASVADRKVYIPVFEKTSMPRDVFKCSWCGGYTKNDKRGHCAGCGGPRNEKYIDDLEHGL